MVSTRGNMMLLNEEKAFAPIQGRYGGIGEHTGRLRRFRSYQYTTDDFLQSLRRRVLRLCLASEALRHRQSLFATASGCTRHSHSRQHELPGSA